MRPGILTKSTENRWADGLSMARRRRRGRGSRVLVQSKRKQHAALKLMRKLLKKYAFAPERLVPDDLGSYAAGPAISASSTCMSAGGGGTIGPRISVGRPDGGSARCSASRARAPRRNSSQPTPPCTTLSTSKPSHVSSITPRAPRRGDEHVARGRRGRMKIRTPYSPLALFTWQRDDALTSVS